MKAVSILVVCVVASLAVALGAIAKSGGYHPNIDPANFQSRIDNPYFPLVPGTEYRYVERVGRDSSVDVTTVTSDTKTIMGVACVVVHDQLSHNGKVKEDTFDWYAQDKQGNVWYFGEDTKEFLPGGRVKTEGSWTAGEGKNLPGIIMKANPTPGPSYRQEYSPGNAEDMGQIVAVHEKVTVPYGTFADCVRTKEWSLLEPGTEKKWYARGVGVVREESTEHEISTLVEVKTP
jgi:hypothetical protein